MLIELNQAIHRRLAKHTLMFLDHQPSRPIRKTRAGAARASIADYQAIFDHESNSRETGFTDKIVSPAH
ncbi:hypothetical protein ACH474_25410 [Nocardia rhamnosiphila]|uniref:hypothetical protein n=1 Tax=Nocardia rhamnosiphila TaxID=426716 RepID=UPI0033E633F4